MPSTKWTPDFGALPIFSDVYSKLAFQNVGFKQAYTQLLVTTWEPLMIFRLGYPYTFKALTLESQDDKAIDRVLTVRCVEGDSEDGWKAWKRTADAIPIDDAIADDWCGFYCTKEQIADIDRVIGDYASFFKEIESSVTHLKGV